MRGKTILASMVTLTFMFGFVFATAVAIFIASETTDLLLGLVLGAGATILWSFLVWLISPLFMDLIQRWFYSARNMPLDELGQYRPAVANFLVAVCGKHRIKVPRLKFIDDQTPQAYCYGSYANNARLVVTRGMLHYLDDEELKAVYAHEMGHIVHRDFIVMTVAATLLNVLWNIHIIAKNIRGKNNSRPAYPIALVAFVFWWMSQYMLLYLSRTREYYADEFAGEETGNPNALSMALVKIAYGITRAEQTPLQARFLGGTRSMGISDPRTAGSAGVAYSMVNAQQAAGQGSAYGAAAAPAGYAGEAYRGAPAVGVTVDGVRRIEKVMLFDLYNPWGTVSEIGSTHPLTGKRIRALGNQAQARGQAPLLAFDKTDAQGRPLDMGRMYGKFFFEVTVYFLPHILASMFLVAAAGGAIFGQEGLALVFLGCVVAAIGFGMFIRGLFSFPGDANPPGATVFDLMSDAYASPLRGTPVQLEGTVVGRVAAGGKLSEDMMMEDRGGGLIALNYESLFGMLGNWWFATRTAGRLVGQPVRVVGWFRRSISQRIDLKLMQTASGESISSWTAFWGRLGGVLVLLIGIVIAVVAGLAAVQG